MVRRAKEMSSSRMTAASVCSAPVGTRMYALLWVRDRERPPGWSESYSKQAEELMSTMKELQCSCFSFGISCETWRHSPMVWRSKRTKHTRSEIGLWASLNLQASYAHLHIQSVEEGSFLSAKWSCKRQE